MECFSIADHQADQDSLKSIVGYWHRGNQGMNHSADSRIGAREGCVISVTTLRVKGSLAIFWKWPKPPHF